MRPILKIGGHDYTEHLASDGCKPTRNDLDADGSGRNLLDGLMYRQRIATKAKYTLSFLPLDEDVMSRLENDMDAEFVAITLLDPKTNRYVERMYYSSTINEGVQRYRGKRTVYEGVTFNITER